MTTTLPRCDQIMLILTGLQLLRGTGRGPRMGSGATTPPRRSGFLQGTFPDLTLETFQIINLTINTLQFREP